MIKTVNLKRLMLKVIPLISFQNINNYQPIMKIQLNGETYDTKAADLLSLIKEAGENDSTEGKAIAVNDEVVPSGQWKDQELNEGDRVEVVKAYQGG